MSGSKKICKDWANFDTDVLDSISSKIKLYEDYVAFTGVCKSWRSASKSAAKFNEANAIPLPWLMLIPEVRAGGSTLKSYNLRTGKVRMVDHPETTFEFKRCLSSMGWLVVTEIEGAMSLLHPLTRNQIPLPNYKTLKFSNLDPNLDPETVDQNAAYAIHKAVLSSKPSEDYIIMILTGERYGLAFWKPGVSDRGLYPKGRTEKTPLIAFIVLIVLLCCFFNLSISRFQVDLVVPLALGSIFGTSLLPNFFLE